MKHICSNDRMLIEDKILLESIEQIINEEIK
jgi:hypothetical protein